MSDTKYTVLCVGKFAGGFEIMKHKNVSALICVGGIKEKTKLEVRLGLKMYSLEYF